LEPKDKLEAAGAFHSGFKKLVQTKHAVVYKFLKKTGRNCGPLQENEERDRNLYEYSDEM
jgi:hypothetical protein